MPHPAILETATLHWAHEAACQASAQALAAAISTVPDRQAVLTLQGDLGAGKTTLTRHLLRALGVQGRIKSPTYAILETYDAGGPIAHFDFYRFQDPQEWEDAGFRDVFAAPGLKLCEWPEQAAGLMPQPDLALYLQIEGPEQRRVVLQAGSAVGLRLLNAMLPSPTLPTSPSPSGPER